MSDYYPVDHGKNIAPLEDTGVLATNGFRIGKLHVYLDNPGDVGTPTAPTTGTTTAVASSASNGTLLASNASRKGASIFNDADKSLYVKFGATASATSFKIKIAPFGYFEFPQPCYTGLVEGLWDASPTGSARISEET